MRTDGARRRSVAREDRGGGRSGRGDRRISHERRRARTLEEIGERTDAGAGRGVPVNKRRDGVDDQTVRHAWADETRQLFERRRRGQRAAEPRREIALIADHHEPPRGRGPSEIDAEVSCLRDQILRIVLGENGGSFTYRQCLADERQANRRLAGPCRSSDQMRLGGRQPAEPLVDRRDSASH